MHRILTNSATVGCDLLLALQAGSLFYGANGHFGETLLNLRIRNGDWPKMDWLEPCRSYP